MSFKDELKHLVRPYEDDEDDLDDEYEDDLDYDDDEEEEEEEVEEAPRSTARRSGNSSGGSMNSSSTSANGRNSHVVPINSRAQIQVVLVKPEKYANGSEVADHLLANRTVVLNLENTEKATARRLLDFLSGAAYAHQGKIQRVAASTYLITPANVQFEGDLKDEMENNGLV